MRNHILLKHVPLVLWVCFMFITTMINEWLATDLPSSFLNELAHIIIHALGFAVLAGVAVWTVSEDEKPLLYVLFAAVLAGLGQETVQSVMRAGLNLSGSLFDICVDVSGALAGMGALRLIKQHRRQ